MICSERRRVPFVAPRADPDVPRLSTHLKCTLRTHVELLSPPGRPCESGVKIGVKNMTCARTSTFSESAVLQPPNTLSTTTKGAG